MKLWFKTEYKIKGASKKNRSLISVVNIDFILDKTYFEKAVVTLKV